MNFLLFLLVCILTNRTSNLPPSPAATGLLVCLISKPSHFCLFNSLTLGVSVPFLPSALCHFLAAMVLFSSGSGRVRCVFCTPYTTVLLRILQESLVVLTWPQCSFQARLSSRPYQLLWASATLTFSHTFTYTFLFIWIFLFAGKSLFIRIQLEWITWSVKLPVWFSIRGEHTFL